VSIPWGMNTNQVPNFKVNIAANSWVENNSPFPSSIYQYLGAPWLHKALKSRHAYTSNQKHAAEITSLRSFFLVVVHLVFWGGGGKGYYNTIAQSKSLIPKSHLWAVLSNPLHDIILRNVDFRSMLEKKCWLWSYKVSLPMWPRKFWSRR